MSRARPLTDATLRRHAARVAVPTYDRTRLTPSVVHMSVGSFHRSHQAVYFDDLAQRGATGWGVVGVGLRRPEMRQALVAQDCLYTVVARGAAGDEARVIGVMGRYLLAPRARRAVIAALADPRTRLVTLTITALGYNVDPGTGEVDLRSPDVRADLADPGCPRSAAGLMVAALHHRRRAGLPPFTVLSCDNLPTSGALARAAIVGFARLRDPGLARWIDERGAFPDSMVDRITAATTDADREMVAARFGIDDRWPVITEPFSQWVIEDRFCAGRPPLDEVGAQFVEDVRPYALIKTRLLNGTHCALGHLGYLAGHRTPAGAVGDPLFRAYVERLMEDEISPLLPAVADLDVAAYRATLVRRLANPRIGDRLERLCRNGSAKMPVHVLSSIADARAAGRAHPLLTMAVAGWLRFLRGTDEQGRPTPIDDPRADALRALAVAGGSDPRPLLADRTLFGDLGRDPGFADDLERALAAIDVGGARNAVRASLVEHERVAA